MVLCHSIFSRQQVLKYLPAQTVNRHFRTVDSNVDNCALAMFMGDYVVVEFTQTGALYAYKVGSSYYREAFQSIGSLSKSFCIACKVGKYYFVEMLVWVLSIICLTNIKTTFLIWMC